MKDFYTYHQTPIITITIPSYTSFLKMIETNKKKTKSKRSNNFYYFLQLYINSIIYYYPTKSNGDIFNILMSIMKDKHDTVEYHILNKMIIKGFENINAEKSVFFTQPKNFIFDNKGLNEYFNGDKAKIKKYKAQIILQHNKKKENEAKEKAIREEIKMYAYNNYYKHQIINILITKYSKNFVYKHIKDFDLKERSEKYIQIDKLLNILFNRCQKKITINDIVIYLNECGVKIKDRSFFNYLNVSPSIKYKLDCYNTTYITANEVKKENNTIIAKDKNNALNEAEIDFDFESTETEDSFLDDEDILNNYGKKIITWEEMEEIENNVGVMTEEDIAFLESLE